METRSLCCLLSNGLITKRDGYPYYIQTVEEVGKSVYGACYAISPLPLVISLDACIMLEEDQNLRGLY